MRRLMMLWARLGDDFDVWWAANWPGVYQLVVAGQVASAAAGVGYVSAVLAETGQRVAEGLSIDPYAFAGAAADGRDLKNLLYGAVTSTKTAVGNGLNLTDAKALGGRNLFKNALTTLQDSGRQFVAADITGRPTVTGYVRMLNAPSCSRCVILAGKWFRWNQGFQRHPRCDCKHIPASENVAGSLTTDPYAYFGSLSEDEQDKLFGEADARAIRDGADIYRVHNIRLRGLADDKMKNTPGHNRGWQARLYDTPSKLTVDDIYKLAGNNRPRAIQLMRDNGFILPGGQVAGGVIKGNDVVGFSKNTMRLHAQAELQGFGHTAAERRLQDAVLRVQAADQGRNPYGVGPLPVGAEDTARKELNTAIRRFLGAW